MRAAVKSPLVMAVLLTLATSALCDQAADYVSGGNAKFAQGDWDGAIKDYSRAIELEPNYAAAYDNRGNAKRQKGDWDGALADYTHAIDSKPEDLIRQKKGGNASPDKSDDFNNLGIRPEIAQPYKNRGDVKYNKHDLTGAMEDYEQAILLKPEFAEAYNGLGDVKKDQGDLDGAIADYNHAIELKPDLAVAYNGRGMAKRDKGNVDGAMEDCTLAIDLDPKFAWAFHTRGCLRYDLHHFSDALDDFHAELALASANDYARYRVWLIRARTGDAQAATAELQTYLDARFAGKTEAWDAKIGRFLAGQLAESDFLATAMSGRQKNEPGLLCQCYFYAGSKHLIAGETATAAEDFQKSVATNEKSCFEYLSAAAELKFLNDSKAGKN